MFTLCIPTMDRFNSFLSRYLPLYLQNEYISEIIISDENGNDYDLILSSYPNSEKIKCFKNETRLGPFLNKLNACSKATNEWIALIDSDNFASNEYFEIAKSYIEEHIVKNEKNIILAPSKALPRFNFSYLNGMVYKKGRFQEINLFEKERINPSLGKSDVLMNVGNYVLNKYLINNLNLDPERQLIPLSSACDVVYFNTLLFEQLDLNMHIVPNLEYTHTEHDGSIYAQTCNDYKQFNEYVYQRYRNLF